jgi:hypothetical protein
MLPMGCRPSHRHRCWERTSTTSFTVLIASPSSRCVLFCCYLLRCTDTPLQYTYRYPPPSRRLDAPVSIAGLYRGRRATDLWLKAQSNSIYISSLKSDDINFRSLILVFKITCRCWQWFENQNCRFNSPAGCRLCLYYPTGQYVVQETLGLLCVWK